MNNLSRISKHGVKARSGDRAMSWLPFFHDMGLVGLVLAPMNSQTSVDYLRTRDFAMRPRLWLKLITQNRSTVSFSPPFGYELCVKRLRISDISKFDLSSWRLAGIGAETIRPEPLQQFAVNLAPAGIKKEGPSFDLPIALGILAATGQLDKSSLKDIFVCGELSLDGDVRPLNGIISRVMSMRSKGVTG